MEKYNIVVKFNREVIQSSDNQALILKPVITHDNFLTQFSFKSIVTDKMLVAQNQINTVNFGNLVGICYVQNIDNMALEEKESLAQKISAYDFVEYAYVEKLLPMELPQNPQFDSEKILADKTTSSTPSFVHLQGYKDGITPTHIGIDMEYAWSLGITGQGIRIADLETGFNFEHINLKRDPLIKLTPSPIADHGTAVAGVMYAKDIGFGVKGMVNGADAYYGISANNLAENIATGLQVLRAGDVFLYERQTSMGISIDHMFAVDDITREAIKAGIIIMMAAGNGSIDLDNDERFRSYVRRPDNGAIRVGAGSEFLDKADFSTYGSIVHVQGWGTWNVTTTGYGDLYDGGENNNYTHSFSGTSSATPIAASAAVAVQSWYKQQTGKVLTPYEMRALLIETGTPQNNQWNSNHIGPLPNIRNAINELQRRLQIQ